jgi:predicted transcriptional regulator
LPKPRSKIGKFLDKRGISQEWLVEKSGVSRNTISQLCMDDNYDPKLSTVRQVIRALRKIDKSVKIDDFFNI